MFNKAGNYPIISGIKWKAITRFMKIIKLDNTELFNIRTSIERVCKKKIKRNAYLGNYKALYEAIISSISQYKEDCSKGRLRKLFYYTDPELCPENQLQPSTFNINFLNALYLYITNNQHTRATYLEKDKERHDRPGSIYKIKGRNFILKIAIPVLLVVITLTVYKILSSGSYQEYNLNQQQILSELTERGAVKVELSDKSCTTLNFGTTQSLDILELLVMDSKSKSDQIKIEITDSENTSNIKIERKHEEVTLWIKHIPLDKSLTGIKLIFSRVGIVLTDVQGQRLESIPINFCDGILLVQKSKTKSTTPITSITVDYF